MRDYCSMFLCGLNSFGIAVSYIWQLMNSLFSFIWQLVNSLFLGLKFLGFNFSCDQRQYSEDTIHRIDLFSSSKPQRSTLQNLLLVLLINYNKDWKKPLMVWCVCRLLHQYCRLLLDLMPAQVTNTCSCEQDGWLGGFRFRPCLQGGRVALLPGK